jgi:hypothetical protein
MSSHGRIRPARSSNRFSRRGTDADVDLERGRGELGGRGGLGTWLLSYFATFLLSVGAKEYPPLTWCSTHVTLDSWSF